MKNYAELIDEKITGVYLDGIATKILQHIGRIRNESSPDMARRWVMELLQNAGDTAQDGKGVKVRIELGGDSLKFMHNGKPFRVRDILSIVNQVSSKTGEAGTVGQFGTGFMTTFQLSEQVEIDSVLSDIDKDSGEVIPPKRFHVKLDRGGLTKEEILNAISENVGELKEASRSGDIALDPDAFNTVFTYRLNNAGSVGSAKTGVADLKYSILFIMLFAGNLESVEICADGSEATYRRGEDTAIGGELRRLEITEQGDTQKTWHILHCENGGVELAALADTENRLLPLSGETPRVFITYPLIGTEKFPFPVVMNAGFEPNETRSYITLVDNEGSLDAKKNKGFVQTAAELYGKMLADMLSIGFSGFENVIRMPEYKERVDVSESWIRENIYGRICGIVCSAGFIPTKSGFCPLNDNTLRLAKYRDAEEKEILERLVEPLNGIEIPVGDTDWAAAFENYPLAEDKLVSTEQLCVGASDIAKRFLDTGKMPLEKWCSALYSAALGDDMLKLKLLSGELKLFPNQNDGDVKLSMLYGIKELYIDNDIPDIIKRICGEIDIFCAHNQLGLKNKLLNRGFEPQAVDGMPVFESLKIKSHISQITIKKYGEHCDMAVELLLACSRDDDRYDLYKRIKGDMPEKIDIGDFYERNYWLGAFDYATQNLTKEIEKYSTVDQLGKALGFADSDETMTWLNGIYKHNPASGFRIFPNIDGVFISGGSAFEKAPMLNRVTDSVLIDIARQLEPEMNSQYYSYVLDRRVTAARLGGSELTDDVICSKIGNKITAVMKTTSLFEAEEHIRRACSMLLNWLNSNEEKCKRYFPAFASSEDRMKLLTPGEAAKLSQRSQELDALMKELEAGDVEELKQKLKQLKQSAEKADEKDADTANGSFDCYFGGDDIFGMSGDDREEFCKKVGNAGEAYVFEQIKKRFADGGWTVQSDVGGLAKFSNNNNGGENSNIAEVYYPDFNNRGQSGWDIRVTLHNGDLKEVYYIEVKTHTTSSVNRGMVELSEAQYNNALRYTDHFIIALADYSKLDNGCIGAEYFKDIFKAFSEGRMYISGGARITVR